MYKKRFNLNYFREERYDAYIDLKKAKESRNNIINRLTMLKKRAQEIIDEKEKLEASQGIYIDTKILSDEEKEKHNFLKH